jgi:hypothetical protein
MLLDAPASEQVSRHGKMNTKAIEMGDPGTMMSYMFDTIYTDKNKVIVQELSCNARDAHREIGTPDKPIVIKLPTEFDPTFSITDEGVGLSPDRINDVYRKIGNSTKRSDNLQTGGFGIGSKTPWAKVNMFLVKTTSMEGDDLVYREYTMIRSGVHFSVNEMIDPEIRDQAIYHTGTTVEMELEKSDWSQIATAIQKIFIEWPVKPIIQGASFSWDYESQAIISGKNFKVVSKKYEHETYVLMDLIPYNITASSLISMLPKIISDIELEEGQPLINPIDDRATERKIEKITSAIHIFFRINCILYFKTGELSPALNREALQYNEQTCRKIISKICSTIALILNSYKDEVAKKETYREALIYWKLLHNDVLRGTDDNFSHIKWRGVFLNTQMTMNLPRGVKALYFTASKRNNTVKLRQEILETLKITETDMSNRIFINDHMNERNLKYFMEQNNYTNFSSHHDNGKLISLTFHDVVERDDKGTVISTVTADEIQEKFFASDMWKGMGHSGPISAIPKRPIVRTARGATGGAKKIPFSINLWVGHKFDTTDVMISDDTQEIVYVLTEHRQSIYSHSDLNECDALLRTTGVAGIYGVSKRMENMIPANWVPLEAAIKEWFEEHDAEELHEEYGTLMTRNTEINAASALFPAYIKQVFTNTDCNSNIANAKWCRLKELYTNVFNSCNLFDTALVKEKYSKLVHYNGRFGISVDLKELPDDSTFDDLPTSPAIDEAKALLENFKLVVLAMSSYRLQDVDPVVSEIISYVNGKQ